MRFKDAKILDKVYCRVYGKGEITGTYAYFVKCDFEKAKHVSYEKDGSFSFVETSEPVLFYRDETSNYLVTRPLSKPDLTKIPVDTKLVVGEFRYKRHFAKLKGSTIACFDSGATSWSIRAGDSLITWGKYAELGEDVTIDGITYPAGTVLVDEL